MHLLYNFKKFASLSLSCLNQKRATWSSNSLHVVSTVLSYSNIKFSILFINYADRSYKILQLYEFSELGKIGLKAWWTRSLRFVIDLIKETRIVDPLAAQYLVTNNEFPWNSSPGVRVLWKVFSVKKHPRYLSFIDYWRTILFFRVQRNSASRLKV